MTTPTPLTQLQYQLDDLKAQRSKVIAEMDDIHRAAGDRPLNAGQDSRWNRLTAQLETLDPQITATREKIEALAEEQRAKAEFAAARGHVDGPVTGVPSSAPSLLRRVDPDDPHTDIRSRAAAAVERQPYASDIAREAGIKLLDQADRLDIEQVADHLLRTSDPAYGRAFRKLFADPQNGHRRFTTEELAAYDRINAWNSRAAMSLTAANGGVLVPHYLDPQVVLTNASAASDVPDIARTVQITTSAWEGVTSAGATASWKAEAAVWDDGTPTFQGPTITTQKLSAFLWGSYEVIADSGFDEVGALVADAFARKEAEAFVSGHNGNNSPYGLITRLSGTGPAIAGSSGAASAADLVAADLYAMDDALPARWRRNAKWLAAKPIYNRIRRFGDSTTAHSWWVSLGPGQPPELLGYPAHRAEDMDSAIVSGSSDPAIVLGDFSQYVIVRRIGTVIAPVPVMMSNGYPTGQAGWAAYTRTGADVTYSGAFKVLVL